MTSQQQNKLALTHILPLSTALVQISNTDSPTAAAEVKYNLTECVVVYQCKCSTLSLGCFDATHFYYSCASLSLISLVNQVSRRTSCQHGRCRTLCRRPFRRTGVPFEYLQKHETLLRHLLSSNSDFMVVTESYRCSEQLCSASITWVNFDQGSASLGRTLLQERKFGLST